MYNTYPSLKLLSKLLFPFLRFLYLLYKFVLSLFGTLNFNWACCFSASNFSWFWTVSASSFRLYLFRLIYFWSKCWKTLLWLLFLKKFSSLNKLFEGSPKNKIIIYLKYYHLGNWVRCNIASNYQTPSCRNPKFHLKLKFIFY